jgi:hypothetical protein
MEATESAFRFLEDINPIRKIWNTSGPLNSGKVSEEISKGKGRVTEGQIEDGIERIRGLFKEISVTNTPQKQPPSNSSKDSGENPKEKPIFPTQPSEPEGPSTEVLKKAEELKLAQEQYRIEAEIVRARIAGDQKRIDSLEREKEIREEIIRLEELGMTSDNAKKTAAKEVDARKAASQAEEARKEARKKKAPVGDGSVAQLGSVAKATNVLMGRSANTGILEENRRQTSLLRTIVKNTQPKTVKTEAPNLVFA